MTETPLSTLWTLDEIALATSGTVLGDIDKDITGVSIDTRTLEPGDMYIAIKGDVQDGHKFVSQAFKQGASLALISQDEGASRPGPCVLVQDTLKAMEDLGRAARDRSRAKRIAITGSVGKTGTKEALRIALSSSGCTHASDRSYNNHWGVPLTLSRLPQNAEFGVFEVGMNAPHEITPLSKLIAPDIAVITNVAPVHLEAFDNVEGIARAKAEIFDGLQKGGTAILNADNDYCDFLIKAAEKSGVGKIVTFGKSAVADVRVLDMSAQDETVSVLAEVHGTKIAYKIGAPGVHLVQNSLAVLAVCAELELDLALCALSLAKWSAGEGRGQKHILTVQDSEATLIDESYNANPVSMRASLETLAATPRGPMGRHIAVLGDMLELGAASPDWHAGLMAPIEEFEIDLVYACGPQMAHLWRILPEDVKGGYAPTAEDLEGVLIQAVQPGDVIMIKGSNGIRLGSLVEKLIKKFAKDQ